MRRPFHSFVPVGFQDLIEGGGGRGAEGGAHRGGEEDGEGGSGDGGGAGGEEAEGGGGDYQGGEAGFGEFCEGLCIGWRFD
mmetsp:Transcript_23083/g.47460  ORF Transcript_23083/g.47460 Transcript_23083/m.47460 type:complete len:81 (+) Transcript_23083:1723-1965(+)